VKHDARPRKCGACNDIVTSALQRIQQYANRFFVFRARNERGFLPFPGASAWVRSSSLAAEETSRKRG
jgi:hypothetical protein